MAKDLPYFKFFCSEWSDGDITLESFETQGLFINICAYYWSNECVISLEKTKKKFKLCNQECFDNLIDSGIIKIIGGNITINFLNEQQGERSVKSLVNSENGKKGGRPKKQTESEEKPNALDSLSETEANQKALREEKIKEDKVINTNLSVDWEKLKNNFNDLTGKKTVVVSEKVKRQIKARLKEGYTKQDIWNAILNCFNDPYHKENPKYLTLEFISRSDKMEKYSEEIKKQKPKEDRL